MMVIQLEEDDFGGNKSETSFNFSAKEIHACLGQELFLELENVFIVQYT